MLGVLFPSLWTERARVSSPEICAAVHGEDVVGDHLAFLDVDRGAAVGATADGEGSVFCGDAEVYGDGGLEAED